MTEAANDDNVADTCMSGVIPHPEQVLSLSECYIIGDALVMPW